MQFDSRHTITGLIAFCVIVIAVMVGLTLSASPVAQAQPAAPNNVYMVTSSSNAAITTCAGAANDCSLRGAVQLANASLGADTINISTTVTEISLSSPITLTDSNITIHGNGQEVTSLKTTGNFPALVINSNDNEIDGFWINASGSHAALVPAQHGIVLNGSNNYIHHNSLSDLGGNGLLIQNSSGNIIDSNTIGVRTFFGIQFAACTYANDQSGIRIGNAAGNAIVYNTIGCNASDGVNIAGTSATGNDLYSNYIGIVNWGGHVPNTQTGVAVWGGAHDNLIGEPYAGNVIGANKTFGVFIGGSGTTTNTIQMNSIGISGTTNISNTYDGLTIQAGAASNQVLTNTMAFNAHSGVYLTGAGTNLNLFRANTIRLNDQQGVLIDGGASNNLIGTPAYGNIIGANKGFGAFISGAGTTANTVQMNSIGISGTTNISNTIDGVIIQAGAASNQVLTNTIAYNGGNGVYLTGAGTNLNLLRANTIRLNNGRGVVIDSGAFNNFVGLGGARSAGNVISANAADGVYIAGATTTNNLVYGNYIGTNAAGNAADPNGQNGVVLDSGTHGNAIGSLSDERNVIAGNTWAGVSIVNGAHDNFVQFNDIGTNRDFPVSAAAASGPARPAGGSTSYLHLPNGNDGVAINGAYTNTIGGYVANAPAPNFIFYNTASGIYLTNGSHHNVIGASEIQGNNFYGVVLNGDNTAYNTITRTLIYQNGLDGIGERNNAAFNVWTEVGVNDNGGLGIDKNATNDGLNVVDVPNLFIDSINRATGVVYGHADPSVLGTTKIELYRVSPDPSGFGEGGVFLGSATTDVSGNWTITDPSPLPVSGCYTAFVTESQLVIPYSSSEFSANTCRIFLPLTLKN